MRRVRGSGFALFGACLLGAGVLPAFGRGDGPPQPEIDRLDAAIQTRFQITDNRKFGITRIPLKHVAVLQMEPQTSAERSVLESLHNKGWSAVLFAARPPLTMLTSAPGSAGKPLRLAGVPPGSVLLEKEGQPYSYAPTPQKGHAPSLLVMVGPLQLTELAGKPPKFTASDPKVRDLLQGAMSGKETRLAMDRWQFVARPVRAGKQACVTCHSKTFGQQLKVGDPLGVAVYAFAASH